MKRSIYSIFVIFSIFVQAVIAQTTEIDSLLNLLKKVDEDTNKVNLLSEISYALASPDPENALQYAKLGIYLGEKLNYKNGVAKCYKSIGVIYHYKQDYQQALENYFKSLNISKEIHDKVLQATTLKNIGSIYYYQGNYDLALEKLEESLAIHSYWFISF